jgi:tetratricopeptide (TPR) repeat protein
MYFLAPRLWALMGLALLVCVYSSVSRADAEGEPTQYRALIDGALEEYQLGHFHEAMALFERAHQLSPSARTLRGLGLASYQARKYVRALSYLRAALDDKRRALTPALRREALVALEASQGFIATFALHVEPESATLSVDGEVFEWTGGGPLLLDPGEHQVVATAPGLQSESRHLSATPGRVGQIEIRLVPLAAEGARPTEEVTQPIEPATEPLARGPRAEPTAPVSVKVLTIGGLSVALVGAALGTAAGVKAINLESELARICPDKECSADQAGQLDDAKRWGSISTASLAVGGAGLIAGVIGVVLWRRHAKRDAKRSHAAAQLTPLLLGSGVGLRGSF